MWGAESDNAGNYNWLADMINEIKKEEEIEQKKIKERRVTKMDESNYKYLEYSRSWSPMNHIQPDDYKELIDVALDNRDFKWAKQLEAKRKRLEKRLKDASEHEQQSDW